MNKKVLVIGCGYVGLSMACLLARAHHVVAADIDLKKIEKLKNRQSPIKDSLIEAYITNGSANIKFTANPDEEAINADFIIVATPTDYDTDRNFFNTTSVESVIQMVNRVNPRACVVIKSTVPVGFTQTLREKYPDMEILFSPEFLREGKALLDNLHPSRIIVGGKSKNANDFAAMLAESAEKKKVDVLLMSSTEAEAVKLFSNTYLAMRVAFFNELDSYAMLKGLNAQEIINGVSLDQRIGKHYNNPSFGYGGYCLPKDTKQLLANYEGIPQTLISAIVSSNPTRINLITNDIAKMNPRLVGVYRLVMKSGSDNFRSSSIQGVISGLKSLGVNMAIYEPEILEDSYMGLQLIKDLTEFKNKCDLILANRREPDIEDVYQKIYTRDIFGSDA